MLLTESETGQLPASDDAQTGEQPTSILGFLSFWIEFLAFGYDFTQISPMADVVHYHKCMIVAYLAVRETEIL